MIGFNVLTLSEEVSKWVNPPAAQKKSGISVTNEYKQKLATGASQSQELLSQKITSWIPTNLLDL